LPVVQRAAFREYRGAPSGADLHTGRLAGGPYGNEVVMKPGLRAAAAAAFSAVAAIAVRDLLQRDHALLRNFPVLGHGRYLIEAIGPELRQYVVAGNNEERPFTRDQRRWVYASAKKENNYFGFGTDNDLCPPRSPPPAASRREPTA
jgi:hypothetical protein